MSARKRLWRVTAYYRQEKPAQEWTTVKHYQTEAAARHRLAVLTGAVEPINPNPGYAICPRPERVTIERSAPVDGWELVAS